MIQANHTNNAYMPEILNNKAEQLIRNADPNKPFYMYFATPAVHTGFEPYGAVQHTIPQFQLRPHVLQFSDAFPERKKQLGILQVLDESFKRVTDALVHKGIVNNTIVVFFADNGAPLPEDYAFVHGSNHGSNWPLRQGKGALFEGGVRTVGFIWSPLLKKRGRITNQLFHVTDWLPTLFEAAGGNPADLPSNGDGYSHWKSFQSKPKTRTLNQPRPQLIDSIDTLMLPCSFQVD
jgi:arylsulfatase B